MIISVHQVNAALPAGVRYGKGRLCRFPGRYYGTV